MRGNAERICLLVVVSTMLTFINQSEAISQRELSEKLDTMDGRIIKLLNGQKIMMAMLTANEGNPTEYDGYKCIDYSHYCDVSGDWYDGFRSACAKTCNIECSHCYPVSWKPGEPTGEYCTQQRLECWDSGRDCSTTRGMSSVDDDGFSVEYEHCKPKIPCTGESQENWSQCFGTVCENGRCVLDCSVDGGAGDGTAQGTCPNGFVCYGDGVCQKEIDDDE